MSDSDLPTFRSRGGGGVEALVHAPSAGMQFFLLYSRWRSASRGPSVSQSPSILLLRLLISTTMPSRNAKCSDFFFLMNLGAGEVSQSVKHLPYKHKDLGRSQNSHKKVAGSSGEHIESKCWRDKDRWIPGVPQSPGLACLWSSRFSKRLKNKADCALGITSKVVL